MTPLDPQLAVIVAVLRARGEPSPFSGDPAQARQRLRGAFLATRKQFGVLEVGSVEDVLARGADVEVPVRIYRPQRAAASLPTVLFLHGGGFVLGSVETADDIARKLCRDIHAVIVSVDYRLAPEHPFPAAHDDALAAARWVLRHVPDLGGDERRVAIAGESAGANLAASTTLAMRGAFRAQLLVVPGLDVARDVVRLAATDRDYPMLGAADLKDIARLYMGPRPHLADRCPPSPLRAETLVGLPPAVIALAGHDPLHDEGRAYAERLRSDGVPVDLLEFPDMFHPFLGFFHASDAARRANDAVCHAFATLLHPAGAPPHSIKETP